MTRAALLVIVAALALGWFADRQRHAAVVADLRLQIAERELDIAEAQRAAEADARATENAGVRLTREIDHAYQADLGRLARVPARRLRIAATEAGGAGLRVAQLPGAAGSPDADTADPVPDPGCDRLAVDAAHTTLMLWRLQTWVAGLDGICRQPQGGGN